MKDKKIKALYSIFTFISLAANAVDVVPVERLAWEGDDLPNVEPVYDEGDDYWGRVTRFFDYTLAFSHTDN